MTAAQVDARVDDVALQVGLPLALLPRYAHQLSGGQKARAGIARALAVKPRLLILTGEVSSPIDPPAHVCRFHGRCPQGGDRCAREAPLLRRAGAREVACRFAA